MNVFEDLIIELKEENLLERTVVDDEQIALENYGHLDETEVPTLTYEKQPSISDNLPNAVINSTQVELDGYDAHLHETVVPEVVVPQPQVHRKPRNGQEFYRKRAMAEVSNLQMVEHVLTGVEREYMKVKPRVFDEFEAKKALNTFLQVAENENSSEHKEAEFRLMSETETWCTALCERDREIMVSNLRQYCENSRPPLSSQALVSLARFYRNLPYSESVRSKFDFVITRLFSRPKENEMRTAFFSHEETLTHIHTLYRDWSSIALYGAEESETMTTQAALSFGDLAKEAEGATAFDQLIESDFFGRVRGFKQGIGETFYAPPVLAAAIDANVRIGNAYVKLIDLERQRMDSESIKSKYGDQHDDSISDGIGRTLDLVDILRSPLNRSVQPVEIHTEESPVEKTERVELKQPKILSDNQKQRPAFVDKAIESFFAINRWVAVSSIILVTLSLGIYIYANFFADDQTAESSSVRGIEIDDPLYKDYVTTARLSGETLYGMLLPTWEGLSKEKKQEILLKMYQGGKDKGYTQVNLLGIDGKQAAYASANRLDIYN